MKKLALLVPQIALAVTLVGCQNTSGNTAVTCSALTTTKASPSPNWGGTVFTIVMENKGLGQIRGNGGAPFINQLIKQNALAGAYHDSYVHPSEPNYLWMVAGENFGVLNDNDPGATNHIATASHLADQLEAAGLSWKSYQESLGPGCGLSSNGDYAAKHNPFVYFDDINGWDGTKVNVTQRCTDHIVDYSQFDADLAAGKLPRYAFITPNLQNDMHDGSIAAGDQWLAREVPKILGSDAFNKGGVLFLLWDEGQAAGITTGDDPPFIVISPNAKPGYESKIVYDTSSFLKTVQTILGIDTLPCNPQGASVQAMDDLFTVPLSGGGTATPADAGTPATATTATPTTATATPTTTTPTTATPTTTTATPTPTPTY
ncbi:MAG: putative acid phosphatase [Myxococcales bacterium]|nr:putative acid phosphatase [Myxococcales bacterium]